MAGIVCVIDVDVVSMVKFCAVRPSSSTTTEPFARVMYASTVILTSFLYIILPVEIDRCHGGLQPRDRIASRRV